MSALDDTEVVTRLVRLADSVPAPTAPIAGDLARGRGRLRRRRALLCAGSAAAVAVVMVGGLLLPGGDRTDGRGPLPASQGPGPSRAVDLQPTPPVTERELPFGESLPGTPDPVRAAAEAYAVVLADLLDPQRDHVELPTANQQVSGSDTSLTGLGTSIGWRQPGESGLGVLEVSVGPSVRGPWSCDAAGWTCTDAAAPDGSPARVARHDGVLEVRVSPPGRAAVTLTANPLWGNNSRVPISSLGLEPDQLIAAASDPRLVLPEGVGVRSGGDLPRAALRPVGTAALIAPGETFRDTTGPDSLLYTGRWRGADGARGRLQWDLQTDVAGGATTCKREWYERCLVHTVDGVEIFVGYLRGGGWRVVRPGPHAVVTVEFDGTGLPIERAYTLAADDRLQVGP